MTTPTVNTGLHIFSNLWSSSQSFDLCRAYVGKISAGFQTQGNFIKLRVNLRKPQQHVMPLPSGTEPEKSSGRIVQSNK